MRSADAGVWRPVQGRADGGLLVVRGPLDWIMTLPGCRGQVPERADQWFFRRRVFHGVIESAVSRFGEITVVTDRMESSRVCDTRCRDAESKVEDCTCVCQGLGHQQGRGYVLSGTTVMREKGIVQETRIVRRP